MIGSFEITSIRLYTPLCNTWLRLFLHEPNTNCDQSLSARRISGIMFIKSEKLDSYIIHISLHTWIGNWNKTTHQSITISILDLINQEFSQIYVRAVTGRNSPKHRSVEKTNILSTFSSKWVKPKTIQLVFVDSLLST